MNRSEGSAHSFARLFISSRDRMDQRKPFGAVKGYSI